MSLLDVYRHLLPRTPTWRLSLGKTLTKLFQGLSVSLSDANEHTDQLHVTLDPQTTGELLTWENEFGLFGTGTEGDRRASLASAWSETGGQSPAYLQKVVRAAGFDVYIHQWWTDDAPLAQTQCGGGQQAQCGVAQAQCTDRSWLTFTRNPFDHCVQPLIGDVQCGQPSACCSGFDNAPRCSDVLKNEPGYIVNISLGTDSPPPIPSDPDSWRYFLYWGGATFGTRATVPKSREMEFKRLLLKICPARDWLVLLVDFVDA